MSIFGITKGYSLFSVEHLMILTVRGRHRKPIIDFPRRHNDVVFEGRGSLYIIYFLLWNQIKNVRRIQSGPNKDQDCSTESHPNKSNFWSEIRFNHSAAFKWSHLTTLAKLSLHSAFVPFICVPAWCRRDASSAGVDGFDILNHRRASAGVDTEARWKRTHQGSCDSAWLLKECVRERKHQTGEQVDGSQRLMFTMETAWGGNREEQLSIFEPKQRFHLWKKNKHKNKTTGHRDAWNWYLLMASRRYTVHDGRLGLNFHHKLYVENFFFFFSNNYTTEENRKRKLHWLLLLCTVRHKYNKPYCTPFISLLASLLQQTNKQQSYSIRLHIQ